MLAGCFWRTYGARAAMHVDLLLAMTRKGADLVKARRFTPENLPELHYPLDRARGFAAAARRRSGVDPPPSLPAFETMLDRYASFVAVVDDARQPARSRTARPALRRAAREVRDAAEAVRRALATEGRA